MQIRKLFSYAYWKFCYLREINYKRRFNSRDFSLLRDSDSITSFWEASHSLDAKRWLTGSSFSQVAELHNLENYGDLNSKTILNVGVGLGACTQELSRKSKEIDVLDISERALERVKSYTRRQFISSKYEMLPTLEYDLIIHNLVAQHMNDEDLSDQLLHLKNSLKPSGVLTIQFLTIPNSRKSTMDDLATCKLGEVGRTLECIHELIEHSGLRIESVSEVRQFPEIGFTWHVMTLHRDVVTTNQ